MVGSVVLLFNFNQSATPTGTPIATATTDANGAYSVTLVPPPTGAVGFIAAGGTYQSEEDGATITNVSPLITLVPSLSPGDSVELNPLTLFIFVRAFEDVAANHTPLNTALANAVTLVTGIYALGNNPATLIPDYTPASFVPVTTDSGKLGLVLGALINEDQLLCPSSPGGLVTALSDDLSDGVFDGMIFGVPVPYCSGDLPPLAGTALFQDALSGVFGSQLMPRAFAFTGIALSNGGTSPSDLVSSLSEINSGILEAIASPVNSMTPGPPMGTPTPTFTQNQDREGATATLLLDGRVLIAGGLSSRIGIRNDAVLYSSSNNTFTPVATSTMSAVREFATATLLRSGKVLIAGGLRGTGDSGTIVNSTTDIFDPSTNTFTQGPNMSASREHAAAVLLSNGTVLIAGGDSGSGARSDSDIYTPAASGIGSFGDGPSMTTARTGLMATLLSDGTALFAGGNNASGVTLQTAEIFNLGSGSPSFALVNNQMTEARTQGTATLLPNGDVLIAGGCFESEGLHAQSSTDLFLGSTGLFQSPRTPLTTNMTSARCDMSASLTAKGTVIISGGFAVIPGVGLSSTELYTVSLDTFSPAPVAMSTARALQTSTLLSNGKVLIAGGFGSTASTNSTDLYTP